MLSTIPKRLKVAHVIPDLDLNVTGGVGMFLRTLTQYLDREIENIVITFKSKKSDRLFFEHLGIPVFSLLADDAEMEPSLKVMQWLTQTFQTICPDVVHTNLFWADTLGRQAAYRTKVPVIVTTEHNGDLQETSRQQAVKRHLAACTDRIVCVSKSVKQHVHDIHGIPKDKISVIHNGIPLENHTFSSWSQNNQTPEFVFIGRLEPQKAPLRLLEAFTILATETDHCNLTLIGDGSLTAQCQSYARRLDLGNRIHFLGYQPHPWEVVSPDSIFVHCCDFEGFGLVIAEAMATGHLCILPKIDGVPEVATEGKEAIFYKGDRDSLIAAMKDALKMPVGQKLQMVQVARARVERDFDANQMAKRYLRLYREIYHEKTSQMDQFQTSARNLTQIGEGR